MSFRASFDGSHQLSTFSANFVLHQGQPNVPTPAGHVRVGNALMIEPPPEGFTRVGNAYMELGSLETERDTEYARLDAEFKKEFKDVFSPKSSNKLPHPDAPRHRIVLKDPKKPINGRLLRVPRRYYTAMREFITENIACGRLRPSSSSIASGTFMVPKKDPKARPRTVHDYRMLNENTVKDHTPLPRQDEILESFVTAKVRGKIDMPESYYQTWMSPKDIYKTAIKTPWGLYEWVVMPQGLCNAPATFQRFMNWVLRGYTGVFCSSYIDDIAIYSNSIAEHKRNVRLILQRLREHGIYASAQKSQLFADSIEFLGHRISSKGIEADPVKLDKITNYPTPTSAKDILSFLGLVNYIAMFDFIPGLADYSSILTKLTRKNTVFRWGKPQEEAFQTIKRLARSVQFLQRLNYVSGDPVWLVTDASSKGIGGYVAQGKDWKTARPIGFYSRQYRSAEFNYPTHEQEMLAVVECMKHWYPQLTGTRFEVLTDHAPLRFWKTQRDLSKRQIRWLDFLCDFDFDIKHIPGVTNTAADALSRYPYAQNQQPPEPAEEVNAIVTIEIDPSIKQKIQKGYEDDTFFVPIKEHPEQFPRYEIRDGLIYVDDERLCIPSCKETREALLRQHHDNENHFGFRKTRQGLARQYFWPGLANDVENYVRSCASCIRNKSTTQAPHGYLHPLPIPNERFSDIAMDFVGRLPKSRGFDTLLVITDRLTDYVLIEPLLSTATAEDVAKLVYRTWYRRFGLPKNIVSDRDKLFVSKFWKELHHLLDIKIKLSTSYHPETDGSSERSNKTVIESLRNYVNRRQTDWADHLVHVETAINNSVNATTDYTPTEMIYGSTVRLFPSFRDTTVDTPIPAVAELLEQISESIAIARDNHLAAKTVQTRNVNKKRRQEPKWEVGDMVVLSSHIIRKRLKQAGRSAKFYPRYIGPFKILKAEPETSNYKLELLPKVDFESIHSNFHARVLRPFTANDPTQFPAREPPRPPPVVPEDNQWTVDRIIDHKGRGRTRKFLVKWEGFPESDNEWIVENDVEKSLVDEYFERIRTERQ